MAAEIDSTISPAFFAIFMILISLSCAFGYGLLSRSLRIKSRERILGCFNRNYTLLLGIFMVLLSNRLYMFMLFYAPVSVSAGTFSSVLISVMSCSVYFLGDTIPFLAYFGYGSILTDAIIFAVLLREPIDQFPDNQLMEINKYGILYWTVLLSILFGGSFFSYWFENYHLERSCNTQSRRPSPASNNMQMNRQYICQSPDNDHMQQTLAELIAEDFEPPNKSLSDQDETRSFFIENEFGESSIDDYHNKTSGIFRINVNLADAAKPIPFLVAQIMYPTCLGIIKGIFVLQFNQNQHLALKVLFNIVLTFGMIIFLVLVYSRFAVSEVFPIEFSVFTFVFVLGGLLFSGENIWKDSGFLIYIYIGGGLLFGGIMVIAVATRRKNLKCSTAKTSKTEPTNNESNSSRPISPRFAPRDEDDDPCFLMSDDLAKQNSIKSSSDPLVSMLLKLPPKGNEQALFPRIPSPFYTSEDDGTRVDAQDKTIIKTSSDALVSIMMKLPSKGRHQSLNEKYIRDDSPRIPSPLHGYEDKS